MPFTEFYCQADGDNRNAGSTNNGTPVFQAVAGNWDDTTKRYVPGSGDPSLVAASGDFASLYINGSGVAQRVHRIEAVDSSGMLLSSVSTFGSTLITSSGNIACRIGGAWYGPNTTSIFPFSVTLSSACQNGNGDPARINLKNDRVYSVLTGPSSYGTSQTIQGYSNTPGDGGKVIIDGGTSGASYILFTGGSNLEIVDIVFRNNGATGGAVGVSINAASLHRCVITGMCGAGLSLTGNTPNIYDCEIYGNNINNNPGHGGIITSATTSKMWNCYIHDNIGSNSFGMSGSMQINNCIISNNGNHGVINTGGSSRSTFISCDFYNNGGDGLSFHTTSNTNVVVRNCNFVKNGGYGVNGTSATGLRFAGFLQNCGFGSGTQANVLGNTISLRGMVESNSISYPDGATPWVDPDHGDFRINNPLAKGRGYGTFVQYQGGGTVSYPDIGAAAHLSNDEGLTRTSVTTTVNPMNPVKNAGSTFNGIPRS